MRLREKSDFLLERGSWEKQIKVTNLHQEDRTKSPAWCHTPEVPGPRRSHENHVWGSLSSYIKPYSRHN